MIKVFPGDIEYKTHLKSHAARSEVLQIQTNIL